MRVEIFYFIFHHFFLSFLSISTTPTHQLPPPLPPPIKQPPLITVTFFIYTIIPSVYVFLCSVPFRVFYFYFFHPPFSQKKKNIFLFSYVSSHGGEWVSVYMNVCVYDVRNKKYKKVVGSSSGDGGGRKKRPSFCITLKIKKKIHSLTTIFMVLLLLDMLFSSHFFFPPSPSPSYFPHIINFIISYTFVFRMDMRLLLRLATLVYPILTVYKICCVVILCFILNVEKLCDGMRNERCVCTMRLEWL